MAARYEIDREKFLKYPVLRTVILSDLSELTSKLKDESFINDCQRFVYQKSGDSCLTAAAKCGKPTVVELLLDGASLDITHRNQDGKQAIHEAVVSGSLDCVDVLIKRKADVNSLKRADWTPLMLACAKGYVKIAERLLIEHCNVSLVNKDGWNAFHIATREGNLKMLKLILTYDHVSWQNKSKNGRTPLHTAAMHGHGDVAVFLLKSDFYESDEKDSCGCTPLMEAVKCNHDNIVSLLIERHNADPYCVDKMGKNALHQAALCGAVKSIRLLIKIGVEINSKTIGQQSSALHLAAKEGHFEAAKLIIASGVHVNEKDKSGRTGLHLASAGGHLKLVSLLLQHDAKNFKDISGATALSYAKPGTGINDLLIDIDIDK